LLGVIGALVAIPMGAAAVIIYREVVVPRQDAL
jgi:predicted PurR-regulated permease PerM